MLGSKEKPPKSRGFLTFPREVRCTQTKAASYVPITHLNTSNVLQAANDQVQVVHRVVAVNFPSEGMVRRLTDLFS